MGGGWNKRRGSGVGNRDKVKICKRDPILTNGLPDFYHYIEINSTIIASQNYNINTLI